MSWVFSRQLGIAEVLADYLKTTLYDKKLNCLNGKKWQQNEVVIWSCRKMSFGYLILIYSMCNEIFFSEVDFKKEKKIWMPFLNWQHHKLHHSWLVVHHKLHHSWLMGHHKLHHSWLVGHHKLCPFLMKMMMYCWPFYNQKSVASKIAI